MAFVLRHQSWHLTDLTAGTNAKKKGMFGKLRDIFGSKKRRTKSHDAAGGVESVGIKSRSESDTPSHSQLSPSNG